MDFLRFLPVWFCPCGARDPRDLRAGLTHGGDRSSSSSTPTPPLPPGPPPVDRAAAFKPPPPAQRAGEWLASSSSANAPAKKSPPSKPPPAAGRPRTPDPEPIVHHHWHQSEQELNLGPSWAHYAFLTWDQMMDGWTTRHTADYSRVYFHHSVTNESRWSPPPPAPGPGGGTGDS